MIMEKTKIRPIDIYKNAPRKTTSPTTAEALSNVDPFDWEEDVLEGKKKVIVSTTGICVK